MKNQKSRWFIVAFLTLIAIWAVSAGTYNLGVDLAGGTILIYEANVDDEKRSLDMTDLAGALKERLDPAGLFNYVIRPLGSDRIEIIMPQAEIDDVDRVKRLISTVGQLQFKIVANRRQHADLIDRAELSWPNKLVGVEGVFVPYGLWLPVEVGKTTTAEDVAAAEKAWPEKQVDNELKFLPANSLANLEIDPVTNLVKTADDGTEWVLTRWDAGRVGIDPQQNLVREDDKGDKYVLMFNDQYDVTGEYLTRVYPTSDRDAQLAVGFQFDAIGETKFYNLTRDFEPDEDGYKSQLGVILDNRLRSAPQLNERIGGGSGIISGDFTQNEIDELVRILEAGELPFALQKDPASTYTIGPTLGEETRFYGQIALLMSLAVVVVFILVYYRLVGIVAIIGLALNILFTVALMVMFKATWTLPGLAGLVLTVGMSVDANVLIYERIREELENRASLGMAIRNGYDKAFSTIFDSNTTTILTAIILFAIGTDQVKGFAVTLILGIVTSMFCALYVTRTIIDWYYITKRPRSLNMMKWLSKPEYDFLGMRRACYLGSAIVIMVGLAFLIARGSSNFDIDFTGGTMAGIKLTKASSSGDVYDTASAVLSDVSVENIQAAGEEPDTRYIIRTTERDQNEEGKSVEATIAEAFKDQIKLPKMTIGKIDAIPEVVEETKNGDDQLFKTFPGGQYTTVSFDEPRAPDFLRNFLNTELRKADASVSNPEDLYALAPVGDPADTPDGSTQVLAYKEYKVAMKSGLEQALTATSNTVGQTAQFDPFSQFDSQVSGETQTRAIWAIALSWAALIAYVWFRFGSWSYGLAGVVAIVHDVLIAVGLIAVASAFADIPFLQFLPIHNIKINLVTIAALLTLIGYSINDTIVIFDRIREVRGKSPHLTKEIVNRSLNNTLSRTVITAVTTFLTVSVLYFVGGVGLQGFAFVLMVGVVVGTYSSIFVASPVLLALVNWKENSKGGSQSGKTSASAAAL
ncbi:bifunctional preprotein translocase subunit SecD/SecF [Planctomycetes bacterium Pan216]|uniref:Multifunctional fusion protein n=1 Tax=Kolteria novifilia TaxID=2527975 RepID=A0A518BB02_9BACT|nr:bifunctional preprotein translocase subunit SecD/SecF [Planctomycetes bacterium Pan216]